MIQSIFNQIFWGMELTYIVKVNTVVVDEFCAANFVHLISNYTMVNETIHQSQYLA